MKNVSLTQSVAIATTILLIIPALLVAGSVYGTPLSKSLVTAIFEICLFMIVPLLISGAIMHAVLKGREADGTIIPLWQKITGTVFAAVIFFGLFALMTTLISKEVGTCLMQNKIYGYTYREQPLTTGYKASDVNWRDYVKTTCVESTQQTIFGSFF